MEEIASAVSALELISAIDSTGNLEEPPEELCSATRQPRALSSSQTISNVKVRFSARRTSLVGEKRKEVAGMYQMQQHKRREQSTAV